MTPKVEARYAHSFDKKGWVGTVFRRKSDNDIQVLACDTRATEEEIKTWCANTINTIALVESATTDHPH